LIGVECHLVLKEFSIDGKRLISGFKKVELEGEHLGRAI
jgi:hypothetical protein